MPLAVPLPTLVGLEQPHNPRHVVVFVGINKPNQSINQTLSLLVLWKDVERGLSTGVLLCGVNVGLQLLSGLPGLCEVTSWVVQ